MRKLGLLSVLVLHMCAGVKADATSQPAQETLTVRITDADGAPLSGAKVRAESRTATKEFESDGRGETQIPIPQPAASGPDTLKIQAWAPARTPAWIQWRLPDTRGVIPKIITLSIPTGVKISGVVRNERNQPISGANVRLFFQASDSPQRDDNRGTIFHCLWDYPVTTDSTGRWTCDMAPQRWIDKAFIRPSHPDYVSSDALTDAGPAAALLAGTTTTKMSKGRSFAGRIVDPDGHGVEGAKVRCADLDSSTDTVTPPDGSFQFAHAPLGVAKVFVLASGFAPEVRTVPAGRVNNMRIPLKKARDLRGRVTDDSGGPLKDVAVQIIGWRGNVSIDSADLSVFTDDQGAFRLAAPPKVSVHLAVAKEGYARPLNYYAPDNGREAMIVLHKLASGARVIGRINWPEDVPQANRKGGTWEIEPVFQLPRIGLPGEFTQLSATARGQLLDQWTKSAEGLRFAADEEKFLNRPQGGVSIGADGSFELDGIAPGTYVFSIDRTHSYQFKVPAGDATVDLGVLSPSDNLLNHAGQIAPDFVIAPLDRPETTLSHLRGKLVLLAFGGSWCGACQAQIPELKRLYDLYGRDPRFVMLTLNTIDTPDTVRKNATANGMAWPQAAIGDPLTAWPTRLLFVANYPTFWLIGPEGKVIAMDHSASTLAPMISKQLENSNAGRGK